MTGSRPLTELEIQQLLQSFYGKYSLRNRTLFLLGLNTGARISELLAIDVGDVWRYKRPVDIIYLQKRHTKGKLVGRQITIRSGAQQAIFDLIQWKRQHHESLSKDAPLFASRQGGRLKRKQAHNIFTDAFDACELSGHVTTHSLRKTFANHVLRASGGNIKVLQELLGHQNLSTTEAYLSFDLDELRVAVPDFGLSPGTDNELHVLHLSSNSKKVIPFQPHINTDKKSQKTS
jgi:site-specific recombinase XerD